MILDVVVLGMTTLGEATRDAKMHPRREKGDTRVVGRVRVEIYLQADIYVRTSPGIPLYYYRMQLEFIHSFLHFLFSIKKRVLEQQSRHRQQRRRFPRSHDSTLIQHDLFKSIQEASDTRRIPSPG